jgi:hypothetical protein
MVGLDLLGLSLVVLVRGIATCAKPVCMVLDLATGGITTVMIETSVGQSPMEVSLKPM